MRKYSNETSAREARRFKQRWVLLETKGGSNIDITVADNYKPVVGKRVPDKSRTCPQGEWFVRTIFSAPVCGYFNADEAKVTALARVVPVDVPTVTDILEKILREILL